MKYKYRIDLNVEVTDPKFEGEEPFKDGKLGFSAEAEAELTLVEMKESMRSFSKFIKDITNETKEN